VLGGSRSSAIEEGLFEIKRRLFRIGKIGMSKRNEEELSESGDYPLDTSHIPSITVMKEEETLSSVGRDCILSKKILIS
jgi:hypothetical protein